MGKLILCCGLSGSGKTVFCKKFVKKHPEYIHLNVDDFYRTYNGAQVHENEFEVWISFYNAIHSAAVRGHSVIVDTNALDAIDRAQFVRWFPEFESHNIYWVYADKELTYENNKNRDRVIPKDEWDIMYSKTMAPCALTDGEFDGVCYVHNTNKEDYSIKYGWE